MTELIEAGNQAMLRKQMRRLLGAVLEMMMDLIQIFPSDHDTMTMQDWRIENIVTILGTVALVLGLYWMSHSFHALWGLLLMLNINYASKSNARKVESNQKENL